MLISGSLAIFFAFYTWRWFQIENSDGWLYPQGGEQHLSPAFSGGFHWHLHSTYKNGDDSEDVHTICLHAWRDEQAMMSNDTLDGRRGAWTTPADNDCVMRYVNKGDWHVAWLGEGFEDFRPIK